MRVKGVLTLIGGFLLLLMTGSIFLWGQLNVYVTSYFRQKQDEDLKLSTGGAIFPIMMASLATGIPLGIKGIKFFGSARISLLISSIIASLMVILSSYAERFYQFVIIYGVINGIASGSIYFVPIYMGYLHFPKNKGLVAGINTCGFALCSFLFGLLYFSLVNPNGLSQVSNEDGFSYFEGSSIEVAQNVPQSLRTIGIIFLCVSVAASQMIFYHPNQIGEEEKRLKKQLQSKEAEEKLVQQNLKSIKEEFNKVEGQHNDNIEQILSQQSKLKQNEQILTKQLEIIQLEEEVIQQKIQITHHKDEQSEQAFINPEILNQFQANHNPSPSNYDYEQSPIHQQKLIELIKQDSTPNRLQHQNSFIFETENDAQKLEKFLDQKEKEIEQDLQQLKLRNSQIEEQLNKLGAPSISICLKQPQLYMSIFLGFLSIGFGLLVNGNYKSMAKDYGFKQDSFQSLVGSLGGIANGLCRPMWSTLLDKFSFKRILQILLITEIITSITLQTTDSNKGYFTLWICIIHMTLGGTLGMWPVFSSQLNGVKVGAQLFGLYWYGFSLANLLQFFLVLSLKKKIGFNNIFYIYFCQAILAFLIITFYKFKVNWARYYVEIPKSLQTQTIKTTENEPIKEIQE